MSPGYPTSTGAAYIVLCDHFNRQRGQFVSTIRPASDPLFTNRTESRSFLLVASILCMGILATFLFLLDFWRVNLDEGWYLGAAKLVYTGIALMVTLPIPKPHCCPISMDFCNPSLAWGSIRVAS